MLSLQQKSDFIKTTILGNNLTPDSLFMFARDFDAELLKKRSEIISYQEKSDYFYLIFSGIVKLSRNISGREVVFRFLTTGDFLGDLSVLSANHNLFDQYAVTDLILMRIDGSVFLAHTIKHSQILFNLIYKYSHEISHLANLICIYDRTQPKEKLIYLITELFRLSGYRQNGKVIINNCLTQQEMAGFCGMERTTLFRELKKMENQGWLVQDKHRWEISGELIKCLNN